MTKLNRYAQYAWGVLAFNVFVIVWGAFVRATGSGAGCGNHWPVCNGEVVPTNPGLETIIEFTHRITSGLAFLLVLGLIIWAFRAYPKGHAVRTGATWSMTFMVIETLVGAGLVLFHLVAYNLSVARAVVMAIHLINTFLLMGAITVTAWWASGGRSFRFRGQGRMGWLLSLSFVAMLFLGASGGVTALGDTLFPAESLMQGVQEELSSTAHFLVRLRVYHPLIAIAVGAFIAAVTYFFNTTPQASPITKNIAKTFVALYVFQLILGSFNVVLLAPVWMQLVHLFVSDILLILLVIFLVEAMGQNTAAQEAKSQSQISSLSGETMYGQPG
jgi:heme A synthase